jgi:glycosyltransferase involved in cell wall biosynthesis
MVNCADCLQRALQSHFKVEIYSPKPRFATVRAANYLKYMVYLDVFLFTAIRIGLRAHAFDLVVAVDHAYAPALWLTPTRKRTAFVHDTIAIRQAKGWIDGAPRVRFAGRRYQGWILAELTKMRVLAVNTPLQAEQLRSLGVRKSRLIEVGQLAMENRFANSNLPPNPVQRRPYILHVGSDNWIKNKAFLIRTFEALCVLMGPSAPDLVLAGSTSEQTLQRGGEGPAAEKVEVVSSPTDAQLTTLIKDAAALVMSSVDEGFGLPPLEALMLGRPIILSDIPIFRQIYGDTAAYFDLTDTESAASSIRAALEHPVPVEPGVRTNLLNRYSFKAFAGRSVEWIRAALVEAGSPPPRS